MPSETAKQHRTMEWVKHDPEGVKKMGIPQDVATHFVAADQKAGKFAEGGQVPEAHADVLRRLESLGLKPENQAYILKRLKIPLPQHLAGGGDVAQPSADAPMPPANSAPDAAPSAITADQAAQALMMLTPGMTPDAAHATISGIPTSGYADLVQAAAKKGAPGPSAENNPLGGLPALGRAMTLSGQPPMGAAGSSARAAAMETPAPAAGAPSIAAPASGPVPQVDPASLALPPSAASPGPAAGRVSMNTADPDEIAAAFKKAQEAQTALGGSTGAATTQLASRTAEANQAFQQLETDRQKILTDLQKGVTEAQTNLAGVKFHDFWADKSTGTKIGTAIAIAFGGIGAALSHQNVNAALSVMNNAMERDLEKQKMQYQQARDSASAAQTNYGMALSRTNDQRLADLTIRSSQIEQAKQQADAILAPANAMVAKAQLGIQQQQMNVEIGKISAQLALARATMMREYAPFRVPAMENAVGHEVYATSPEGAQKLNQFSAGYQPVEQGIRDLEAMSAQGRTLSPTQLAAYKSKALFVQNMIRTMEGQGTFREGTARFDAKMIPDNARDFLAWGNRSSFARALETTRQGLATQERGLVSAYVRPGDAQEYLARRGGGNLPARTFRPVGQTPSQTVTQ